MKKNMLNIIKKIYENGENIIQYLKDENTKNTDEIILISYDFQSGSYIKHAKENPGFLKKYTRSIAEVIAEFGVKYDSILEAGVGEGTTLIDLIPQLKTKPKEVYGFDLSWSRVRYALEYSKVNGVEVELFMGNLFNIPLADSSIDIVYTSHSVEPNGGREKEALIELVRVTKKYLILLEPAYEFANEEARKRMEQHGYVKNLYSVATSLGLNIIEHRLFDICSNPLNPTGIIIIEKAPNSNKVVNNPLVCPITKTPMELIKNSYFTKNGLLAYPVVDGVPCLLENNAIIATHYLDDFRSISN
ncbi:MAG: methyltransferase domain-containing protein [Gammaproteobacteria bacterium]